ncbi:rhamnan synthesis F family protein [Comamonas sp. C24C]
MAIDAEIHIFLNDKKMNKKSALVVHVFYEAIWEKILDYFIYNNLEKYFDIFITTPTVCSEWVKKSVIGKNYVKSVHVFENKGKDILPFLNVIGEISENYSEFCKIHTKKGEDQPSRWRASSAAQILGSSELIHKIQLDFRARPDLGMIGASARYFDLEEKMYKNKENFEKVVSAVYGETTNEIEDMGFFGGTVFWGDAQIFSDFSKRFLSKDFEFIENDEKDGMLEHAIERVFGILPKIYGCETRLVVNNSVILGAY